jgi:hypothetical protein
MKLFFEQLIEKDVEEHDRGRLEVDVKISGTN